MMRIYANDTNYDGDTNLRIHTNDTNDIEAKIRIISMSISISIISIAPINIIGIWGFVD